MPFLRVHCSPRGDFYHAQSQVFQTSKREKTNSVLQVTLPNLKKKLEEIRVYLWEDSLKKKAGWQPCFKYHVLWRIFEYWWLSFRLWPFMYITGDVRLIAAESESEVAQSCPTLCDPVDCSLPGSSVHGIFQARVLEWTAISFSRGSSWPRDRTRVSCIVDRRFTVWTAREVWTLEIYKNPQFTASCGISPKIFDFSVSKSTVLPDVRHQRNVIWSSRDSVFKSFSSYVHISNKAQTVDAYSYLLAFCNDRSQILFFHF